jgi:hypothetical protein
MTAQKTPDLKKEGDPMNQSFYTREGLDYLYFARPGTAYGTGQ